MKITRRQLRRLVESIFIGDDDGTVLSPKDVEDLEYSGMQKDDMSRGYHHKLDTLQSTNPKQARSLAVSLGLQDDLTPYEELAVDHIDSSLIHSPSEPIVHPREQQLRLLMRDPDLKRIAEDLTKDFENYIRSPEGVRIAKEGIKQLLYYQETSITPGPIEWSKVNWKGGIIYLTRGFNLGKRIQQKLNIAYGAIEIKKSRALFYHLGNKLEKIAQQRFNKEFAEVVVDEIKGKSFPLALTEAELRKLIAEAFIGAPDGTVYTPQTKKVPSPHYPNYPDQPEDQVLMDAPVVYGQDDTKVATPILYSFLTRNRDDIHNFHEKGPKVYQAIMDPKEDPETKMQFLALLQSYEIITDKELEDIQLELDLLISPDFAEYRRLGAERLKNIHDEEVFDYTSDQEKLYKNPAYVEWAKKQIDKAVDGGFEYFKDAIEEHFFNYMYDYKEKGIALSRLDFNPDEGIDPAEFASLYTYVIGAMLGGYKGFRSTEDAAYYNIELEDYTNDKSRDMILVAIDALVDAGILEELDDGKVRMPEATYQIIRNNIRGRTEDFHKKHGTRSPFLDDPYKPNPNLPVVIKEMIRRMIREGIFIGDTDGTVLSPKDVDEFEYSGTAKDDMSRGYHHKLDALRDTDPKQARSLAVSLDLQDDLTPYEELAVDHLDPKDIHSPDTPVEHPNPDPKLHQIQAVITKNFKNYLTSPEAKRYAKLRFESISHGHDSTYYGSGNTPKIEWDILSHRYSFIDNDRWFNLRARILNKLGYGSDSMLSMLSSEDRAMYHSLSGYLMNKLNKIATNMFNEEYMKVIGGQVEGESFPLALTEAEIRQIIREAIFVGDTDGTVLSPKDVQDFKRSGTAKDDMSRGYHPKLDALQDPKQKRSLAVSLDLQDELTPYEELAVDDIDDQLIDSPETSIEHTNEVLDRELYRIAAGITQEFKQYIHSPRGVRHIKERVREMLSYGLPPRAHAIARAIIFSPNKDEGYGIIEKVYNILGYDDYGYDDKDKGISNHPVDREKRRNLMGYLVPKLEKIAREVITDDYIKVFADQLQDEVNPKSFPLALTEAELKQIIMKELAERKKRKKKKTKSKKRGYLYPYVYGHHDHDFHDYGYDVSDGGFDGGGDGGGGE